MTPPNVEPTPAPFPAIERTKAPVVPFRHEPASDLVRRTLRTVAVLVAACVLFVGVLSIVAVTVTSRALGGSSGEAHAGVKSADESAKKPLSI